MIALKELNAKPIAQTTVSATNLDVPQLKGLLVCGETLISKLKRKIFDVFDAVVV
ncbi:MAG: hypothetical protein P1U39_08385 [Legionellaceae bacterium]|nr:hypothetical protein [Legionellaceae bacterium]